MSPKIDETDQNALRYGVYAWCVAAVVVAIWAVGWFLSLAMNPFGPVKMEFTNLSGTTAKSRLHGWPDAVDARDVSSVSHKYESSRDSHSEWSLLQIVPEAASIWMECVHAQEESVARRMPMGRKERIEGVHRTIAGPPPLHRQTGETPNWWNPPNQDVRATEVMIWYSDFYSGVGRATYSIFDEQTGLLWIYSYAAQHDLLWRPGQIPDGSTFVVEPTAARDGRPATEDP
jgi:hypothetical protein